MDVLKMINPSSEEDIYDELEGITNINACYGGTAAIINSVNWVREQMSLK